MFSLCAVVVGVAGAAIARGLEHPDLLAGLVRAAGAAAEGELCDAAGVEQFSDVGDGGYGAGHILCARALELARGTGGGAFDPEGELTREQMAAFLARLWRDVLGEDCPEPEPAFGEGHAFVDMAGSFAADDIACLYALGIVKGVAVDRFDPEATLTAAQMTLFTGRLWHKAGRWRCSGFYSSLGRGGYAVELTAAARCLAENNVAPSEAEASAELTASRGQMAVYLVGAWHHAAGRDQPPPPPTRPQTLPEGLRLEAVSAGYSHTCGVTTKKEPVCWGRNSYGEARPPEGLKLEAVSAGYSHTCGVTTKKEPVCWGRNSYGEARPPEGLKLKAIDAGINASHVCGVTTQEEPVCWGGQSGFEEAAQPPEGLKLAAIAVSPHGACGITTEEEPVCWGLSPAMPPKGLRLAAVSTGYRHTCGVTTDAEPVCWGENYYGQITPPRR